MSKYRVSSPLHRNGQHTREYYSVSPINHPVWSDSPSLSDEALAQYREMFSYISDNGEQPSCVFEDREAAMVAADKFAELHHAMNQLLVKNLPNIRSYSVEFYRSIIQIDELLGD